MAGRRWSEGRRPADEASTTPRPSERRDAGQAGAGEGKRARAAAAQPAPGRQAPSPEAVARAKRKLAPPPAPWHPLPLSELAIVFGAIAMIAAVILKKDQGLIAGFALILLGTAEFSWREHHHGHRSHGALLSGIVALPIAIAAWKLIGLAPKTSLLVGGVAFAIGWSFLNSYFHTQRDKRLAAGE